MNIFEMLSNLYTNKQSNWIYDVDESDIQPYVIQRWIVQQLNSIAAARWLDKYVFVLSPRMYLSLAWSVLPKFNKAPFIRYIKKTNEEEEFEFITKRIRKHMEMSDNDFNTNKVRIISAIKSNMSEWFSFYGIEKLYWKKYGIDFNLMKKLSHQKKQVSSLEMWGV